jgi:hypothetical protein
MSEGRLTKIPRNILASHVDPSLMTNFPSEISFQAVPPSTAVDHQPLGKSMASFNNNNQFDIANRHVLQSRSVWEMSHGLPFPSAPDPTNRFSASAIYPTQNSHHPHSTSLGSSSSNHRFQPTVIPGNFISSSSLRSHNESTFETLPHHFSSSLSSQAPSMSFGTSVADSKVIPMPNPEEQNVILQHWLDCLSASTFAVPVTQAKLDASHEMGYKHHSCESSKSMATDNRVETMNPASFVQFLSGSGYPQFNDHASQVSTADQSIGTSEGFPLTDLASSISALSVCSRIRDSLSSFGKLACCDKFYEYKYHFYYQFIPMVIHCLTFK